MKKFIRFLVRCLLAIAPFLFVFGFPITFLNKSGFGGALPTLILGGIAFWLSRFLVKKYNQKCDEKDSREIKSFTEINCAENVEEKDSDYEEDRGCATYLLDGDE